MIPGFQPERSGRPGLIENELSVDIRESKTDRLKAPCRISMDCDIDIAGDAIPKSQRARCTTCGWSRRVAASCQQRDAEQKDGQDIVEMSHDQFLIRTLQECIEVKNA